MHCNDIHSVKLQIYGHKKNYEHHIEMSEAHKSEADYHHRLMKEYEKELEYMELYSR